MVSFIFSLLRLHLRPSKRNQPTKAKKIEFLSGNRKGFGTQMPEKKVETGKKSGLKTGTNREKTWQSEIRPQSFSLTEGFMNTITNELKKKWRNWREWEKKKEFIISSWENQDLWNLVVLKFTLYCPPKKRHKKGFEKRQQWFFSTIITFWLPFCVCVWKRSVRLSFTFMIFFQILKLLHILCSFIFPRFVVFEKGE